MKDFAYYSPVNIVFGEGTFKSLPEYLNEARSVLVVTGRSSAKKSGLIDRTRKLLTHGGVGKIEFASAQPNPTISEVTEIGELARKTGAECIVGIGGGSAMDAAKAVSVVAVHDGPFLGLLGRGTFEPEPLPLMLVPTTAGTGSEVNQYSIINDENANEKVNLHGENTYPSTAILDPGLSVTMPPEITVDTGIDALCHAVEGYICRRANPLTDVLAMEVFRTVREALPVAYRNGSDLDARGRMLYAAALAGIVISHTGTTMVHAMGYHLTLKYGISHGRANAALIAHGLRFSYDAQPEKIGRFYSVFGGSEDETGVEAFICFLDSLGVGTKLSDYGIDERGIDAFRDYVMGRRNMKNTPGEVTEEELDKLLREIL